MKTSTQTEKQTPLEWKLQEIRATLGELSLNLNTLRIAHAEHSKALSGLAVSLAKAEGVASDITTALNKALNA